MLKFKEFVNRLWPAVIRAARTFLQTFLGVYLAGITNSFDGLADIGLFEAAVSAGIVAVLSFLQNALEDTGKIPVNLTLASSNKH